MLAAVLTSQSVGSLQYGITPEITSRPLVQARGRSQGLHRTSLRCRRPTRDACPLLLLLGGAIDSLLVKQNRDKRRPLDGSVYDKFCSAQSKLCFVMRSDGRPPIFSVRTSASTHIRTGGALDNPSGGIAGRTYKGYCDNVCTVFLSVFWLRAPVFTKKNIKKSHKRSRIT